MSLRGLRVSVLITNIGELVTNAPRDAVSVASPGPFDVIPDAAVVLDEGLVAWTGLGRRGRQRPTSSLTPPGGPCCPGSSTRTPTWSSPGSAAPSSPPGWPGCRTARAGSAATGGGDQGGVRCRAAREPGLRLATEMLAQEGRPHLRVQVRLRADRARMRRGAVALAAEVTPEVRPTLGRTRHRAGASTTTRPVTSTWCVRGDRCWPRAPPYARWGGRVLA